MPYSDPSIEHLHQLIKACHNTPSVDNAMRIYEELLSPSHSHLLKQHPQIFQVALRKHNELLEDVRRIHGDAVAQEWRNNCYDRRIVHAKYGKRPVARF